MRDLVPIVAQFLFSKKVFSYEPKTPIYFGRTHGHYGVLALPHCPL